MQKIASLFILVAATSFLMGLGGCGDATENSKQVDAGSKKGMTPEERKDKADQ